MIRKRSVRIAGHRTSISLEEEFWADLASVAAARGVSINALVTSIDAARGGNLSSALRLFVRQCYRDGELPAAELATQTADAGADAAGPVTPLRIS
ncbi:MAG TPA: ribbon-helix-helix domain-containing protein [Stellaceae bacterium]|jgi:predicted DNA-binding ribbon-helix-helix protein